MKKAHITCPYCHAPAQLRPASSIYGIHTKDRAAKLYVCSRYPACDAYVQAHKATGLPMGTLADKSLRQKRMQAHRTFNQLWEKGLEQGEIQEIVLGLYGSAIDVSYGRKVSCANRMLTHGCASGSASRKRTHILPTSRSIAVTRSYRSAKNF